LRDDVAQQRQRVGELPLALGEDVREHVRRAGVARREVERLAGGGGGQLVVGRVEQVELGYREVDLCGQPARRERQRLLEARGRLVVLELLEATYADVEFRHRVLRRRWRRRGGRRGRGRG